MNVIRFLLGVTTVVALTGFAPTVGSASEPNSELSRYTLTPALFERGDKFSHDSFIQLERTTEFEDGAGYLNVGVRLFDHYNLIYGGENAPRDWRGDETEYGSMLTPIIEFGRKLDFAPRSVVALYGSYGWPESKKYDYFPQEAYLDLGLTVRSGWGSVKAGVFRSKTATFVRENYHRDDFFDGGPYQGVPIMAYYISFGVGPSFRF